MTKMYKRLLAMVLAVLMVLSMAACGGDSQAPAQETKTTTPAAADAPAPSGEKQKIVIWNNNTNENQLKALEAQMNDIAAEMGF